MTDSRPIVIIGGGHNGLVCAAYLARAGRKVLVLESAKRIGGAATTREFAPGFRVSAIAHLLYGLDPVVEKELALSTHGLSFARTAMRTVALASSSSPLVLNGATVERGELPSGDWTALASFDKRMRRFAALLARQHRRVPPRLTWQGWAEALQAARLPLDIRLLGRRDMREFLRIATMNLFDVLEDTFESAQLKGVLAMDGVLGTNLGPRSGHTVLSLLHRWSGLVGARARGCALPRGGLGAVSDAIASAAEMAGASIRLSSPVAAILMDGDRAAGVRLGSGEEIAACALVSNADPRSTFLELLGARHLEAEFARRVNHLRTKGVAAKLHLALASLPRFRGLDAAHAGERLLIAPDMSYIDLAFNPSKYREYSEWPIIEITLPSVHDLTLAPQGQHVLSAVVQYAPYDLAGGWDAHRDSFRDTILNVLEEYAPGLRQSIIAAELYTPLDIEREFQITGGHWHHGEITLDQYLMLRPVPGAAQYATPINGLYLCGAGSHPGGGVMGSAGRNAANVILHAGRES
ncbi:MAG TPA: NAD(P)/FAD-dependent oxidoreductase [Steroidobacteraceae bacterium]|jgi:phytoene dehydrogenase-like protein